MIQDNSFIYENDFKYLKYFPISKSPLQKFNPCKFGKQAEFYDIFKGYCLRSSFHGMGHFADSTLPKKSSKLIWLIIIIIVLIILGYFLIQIRTIYEARCVKIVVDPLVYPAYYNQFPTVMVCNKNKINWKRIDNATKLFLPFNSTKKTIDLFKDFIINFNNASLGAWSVFKKYENIDMTPIDSIDIDAVLLYLSFDCEELFVKCYWDSEIIPCCKIFIRHQTEMGYCFLFNTRIYPDNEIQAKILKPESNYPWLLTGKTNDGLRAYLKIDSNFQQNLDEDFDGITANILDENEWPEQAGTFIPINYKSELHIERKKYSSRKNIQTLPLEIRGCVFENDEILDNAENQVEFYVKIHAHDECRVHCTQRRIKKTCGCLSSVFLPPGSTDYPPCNPSGYKCLGKNAENVSYYIYNKHPIDDSILKSDTGTEFCQCYEYCSVTFDDGEFQSLRLTEVSKDFNIVLHVFQFYDGIERYKGQINLSDLDYLVYYGGIISMFIGTSVMSVIEILFFTSMAIILAIIKFFPILSRFYILNKPDLGKNGSAVFRETSDEKKSGPIYINVNPILNENES